MQLSGEPTFFIIYLLRVVALSDEKSALNTNFQWKLFFFFFSIFFLFTRVEAGGPRGVSSSPFRLYRAATLRAAVRA